METEVMPNPQTEIGPEVENEVLQPEVLQPIETPVPVPAAEQSVQKLYQEVLDPQLYATTYATDDYVITLVHDVTLGDFLIAMLLCVLIVVKIISAVLGGGRKW